MDGEHTSTYALILLLILGIESIVAFLGNGFIIAVNGHKWFQRRKVLSCDLLLTALGTTRFLLQLTIFTFQLLYASDSELLCDNYIRDNFLYVWIYFNTGSIWCATWLSVFYCVKITNFAHCLLLWLKPRIDVFVPRLLGWSLTVFSLPFIASGLKAKKYCNLLRNMKWNNTQGEGSNYEFQIYISVQFTFIAINVSICLTASILLLISLQRHTRNLKRSGFATKDFNTQAHINVVYSLWSFLFFYIQYLVALTISLSYSARPGIVEELIVDVALSLCPSAHSIILILTNPKLKDVCVQILNFKQRTQ